MIFQKGDSVIFDNHVRKVVCCDGEIAIMALVVPLAEDEGESTNFESLIAVSNNENFEDTMEFKIMEGD